MNKSTKIGDLTVEIVDFYPMYGMPQKKVVFSCHVCIITEQNITFDIRGYTVHMHYNETVDFKNIVYPPMKNGFDYEENKPVLFPIVNFLLLDKNYDFNEKIKEEIISQGKDFLKNFKFPKKFPRNFAQYCKVIKKGLEEGLKKEPKKDFDKKKSFNRSPSHMSYTPSIKKPLK